MKLLAEPDRRWFTMSRCQQTASTFGGRRPLSRLRLRHRSGELAALVPQPEEALVVVADDFPQTVDVYARQTPYEHGGEGVAAGGYNPDKPDGARAGAKTIPSLTGPS